MKSLFLAIPAVLLLCSFNLAQEQHADDVDSQDCPVAQYTMGLRFQQQSGEVRALQLQAFGIATERIDAAVKGVADPSSLAIVSDLDETVISNMALLARDVLNCHSFDRWDTWTPWERDGVPTLIPGAKEFLDHVDSLGVTIRYISDRMGNQKSYTLATLEKLGLPQVSDESVMLLGLTKAERRAQVDEEFEIVLLLGDTLHDFDARFRKTPLEVQKAVVAEETAKWGKQWIVLPNASHGTWAKAELEAWDAETVLEGW
jgi:5'-nucleotidase (lipoprotein e(P4) family)